MSRARIDFFFNVLVVVAQTFAIFYYALNFKHITSKSDPDEKKVHENLFRYSMFQDVHIMIFIGFGFLLSFLSKYKISGVVMCFWMAAIGFQYYFIWNSVLESFFYSVKDKFTISFDRLAQGEASCGALLIFVCAVIGKVNNLQFLILTIIETFLYALNEELLLKVLNVSDVGGSMIIHAFGAFFGLGVTWFLNYKPSKNNKNLFGNQNSYTVALFGTLFLWCFWPSFNAALAETELEMNMAVLNTYFSLIGSVMGTYAVTTFLNKGKFNMDHILNATLAGGVVMGSSANLLYDGYIAYIMGIVIGGISALMFVHAPGVLDSIGMHDVAGVLNLHGVPGIIGGLLSWIFRSAYTDGKGKIQIIGVLISVGMGLIGGSLGGILVKALGYYERENQFFNDIETVALEKEVLTKLRIYGVPHPCEEAEGLSSHEPDHRLINSDEEKQRIIKEDKKTGLLNLK